MYGGMGLCTTCPSSDAEDGAMPTGGTAELESLCYYIHIYLLIACTVKQRIQGTAKDK